ncbi:hypothetical protein [Candidatus Enterovibrio altilux]|uniref:hypothetical protein n=1 Tax=Candidatus Enterovibrio altilux TaxID=1927128 RepID=UPI0016812858|nr:hypothetical protein [Candidatus Enterovibrio luxaltus]
MSCLHYLCMSTRVKMANVALKTKIKGIILHLASAAELNASDVTASEVLLNLLK